MSEDSNDVTKALAAFGAPSIRYHSFGQSQTRPSLTLPRRPIVPPVAPPAEPVLTQQAEPTAAPEPLLQRPVLDVAAPVPPAPIAPAFAAPAPQPITGRPIQAPPLLRPAPLFPPTATVAPPPRPLAEWAAPIPSQPPVVSAVPAPAAHTVVSSESVIVAPSLRVASPPPPVVQVPVLHPLAAAAANGAPAMLATHLPIPNENSNLAEVFAFLAAS